MALIAVDKNGENSIVVVSGANAGNAGAKVRLLAGMFLFFLADLGLII